MEQETVADAGTLLERMSAKITRQRALGYKFAMVYVTPAEKERELVEGTLESLLDGEVTIHPSLGSDRVKLERGDADHEFFYAKWGDVYGLEAAEAARTAKEAEAESRIRLKAEKAQAVLERKAAAVRKKAEKGEAARGRSKASAAKPGKDVAKMAGKPSGKRTSGRKKAT